MDGPILTREAVREAFLAERAKLGGMDDATLDQAAAAAAKRLNTSEAVVRAALQEPEAS